MKKKFLLLSVLAAALSTAQVAVAAPGNRAKERDHRAPATKPVAKPIPAPAPPPMTASWYARPVAPKLVASHVVRDRSGQATFQLDRRTQATKLTLTTEAGVRIKSIVITYANGKRATLSPNRNDTSIAIDGGKQAIRSVKVEYTSRQRARGRNASAPVLKLFRHG